MQMVNKNALSQNKLLNNACKGAIAGAVAVWVMDRLDWYMFNHEDRAARRQTEAVRPHGLDPAHEFANRLAQAKGTHLSPAQPHPAGIAVHYAMGIGPGALYAAFRDRLPIRSKDEENLYALALGLGLFLVQDEGINTVSGLAARPRAYPWQAHARGLISHLVFGFVTNKVLNLLGAARPKSRASTRSLEQQYRDQEESAYSPLATGRYSTESRPTLH